MNEAIRERLQAAAFDQLPTLWRLVEDAHGAAGQAWLGRNDRYYLLTRLLHRPDAVHPWLYARCREVEASPDGHLDLWAREHYKSTIITFAGIIQEILRDPEITVCIFSHTKPVARKFMLQIKAELETNADLKRIYPDVLWSAPHKEAPKWSEEKGLVVKRRNNPKEATLEAHGLVDGQPTGAHFRLRVYDDVVTKESVSTPDQVAKTTDAWSLSDNLGAVTRLPSGREVMRTWHIGTRYSYADTYQHILDEKILVPRIFPATDDGTIRGAPVFLSADVWAHKLKTQLESTIACQQLQNPVAGTQAMFRKEHLRFAEVRPRTLNIYIMCDPAGSKKKGSDRTAMAVIGVDAALNKYLLDGYCHRMNLKERWAAFSGLRRKWMIRPGVQGVFMGYEKYGMQSDIEHFETQMELTGDAFLIRELNWTKEGSDSKMDRIQRLYPDFASGKFWLPAVLPEESKAQRRMRAQGEADRIFTPTRQRNEAGVIYSLSKMLIEEYLVYPFAPHDDFLDVCARIYDMEARPPILVDERALEPEVFSDGI